MFAVLRALFTHLGEPPPAQSETLDPAVATEFATTA